MATIKVFRSETQRVTPQTQALGLRAPDLGIVGRAVSQFGQALGVAGEERAKINAAAKATAAHKSYRDDMLNVEREARKLKPENAEAYYLQHSKNAYNKANNSLSSTYAKSLYATQAGQTSYTSRAKFYKEHDARLVSTAVANADLNASGFADIAGDLLLSVEDRWKGAKSAVNEYVKLSETGAISPEKAVELQRAWSGATLERILRSHMMGATGKTGGAVAIIQKFKAGKLDDEVANKLAGAVDKDELTKIEIRMEKAAHRIETHKRQTEDRDEKLAIKAIKIDTGLFYSATDLKTARFHYDRLLTEGGFDSKSERENAQKWLGSLGDPEFSEKADAVAFRTGSEGSSSSAVSKLHGYDRQNILTPERVELEKGNLTEAAYKFWMGQVQTEKKEGTEAVVKIMDAQFKYTRYQNKGDTFEKEQTLAAYSRATGELYKWQLVNPEATHAEIVAKGFGLIEKEIVGLRGQLTTEFINNALLNRAFVKSLAPVPDGPSAGTMDAMKRVQYMIAKHSNDSKSLPYRQAMTVMRKLSYYRDFGVPLTMPEGN